METQLTRMYTSRLAELERLVVFLNKTEASADSRKIFRLGRFVSESAALCRLAAAKPPETAAEKRIQALQMLSRAAFFCYWIFDNAFILAKLKVIHKDQQRLAKLAGICWMTGLLAGVYCELLRLREAAAAAQQLQAKETEAEATKEAAATKLQLQQTIHTARANLIKQCCDLVPAVNMAGVPALLLRRQFNDGFVGLAGAVSAAIACCQIY